MTFKIGDIVYDMLNDISLDEFVVEAVYADKIEVRAIRVTGIGAALDCNYTWKLNRMTHNKNEAILFKLNILNSLDENDTTFSKDEKAIARKYLNPQKLKRRKI